MKDVLLDTCVKAASECEESCFRAGCECCEEAFHRILEIERKRSERSKRPFMLLLVSLDGVPVGDIRNKALSCLASSKRDIDVLGWYRQDAVAGIIFTEIADSSDRCVSDSIERRIKAKLALELGSDGVKTLPMRFCFFPEQANRPVRPGDLTLYPEIKERLRSQGKSLLAKRVIDICGAFAALVVFSPFFLLIGAMVKLSSKGPIFFRQERVGRHGRTFTFLKFRSMYADSDPSAHMEYTRRLIRAGENGQGGGAGQKRGVFKLMNDPRVTPVGRFLRRSSLDELPQFIKVLTGEMSLVGPRPPIPYELENYDLWHWIRVLEMKPGITGLWQVMGRSKTTFDDMVRLDIYYIRHWSVWLDLKLILRTPLAVLSGNGAY